MRSNLRIKGGKKLISPTGSKTRPTTSRLRESLMNILGEKLTNSSWLDLYSGSGVIGCEAIQRGAINIVAIEKDDFTSKLCKSNLFNSAKGIKSDIFIEVINYDSIKILNKGFSTFKERLKSKYEKTMRLVFDFIYIDPPYDSNLYLKSLKGLVKGGWVSKESIVICEHSKGMFQTPNCWLKIDQRSYGSSNLTILSPQASFLSDIDSKRLRIGQEG
tara:strand:+ start:1597 stop:2247 length:651 start_codon:yes stop_codon:yes gene_type:complete